MKQKIIVILGPTASGKSDLAVKMARTFNGEIISADSRQVYKGLNLGSGKISAREMHRIPHHLLDVANPKKRFSVESFKNLARVKIKEIAERGNVPIICGGTGFYIQTLIDNTNFPEVAPNPKLRKKLGLQSASRLFSMLKKLDYVCASTIDPRNKVRLIRAIEIAKSLGHVPKITQSSPYDSLQIGIDLPDKVLKEKISDRLLARLRKGMIREVINLRKKGLSWKRLDELGLEYRFISRYLRKIITREEMIQSIQIESWHFAKRQRTWFRKNKRIMWFRPGEKRKILSAITNFLE
ncbi:MAG: tRNA (adenosine(37)-N6)-dimethylallyltransferase MiaA [Candidatus Taylorbacteria bacterium]